MNHLFQIISRLILTIVFALGILFAVLPSVSASESSLITTVEDFTSALLNAREGDTILVGDIAFKPMPAGMIVIPKNVTVKSGKSTNAVFTHVTLAFNGTASDSSPLTVVFENIDFRGDRSAPPLNPSDSPAVSSRMPDMMKTMCAAIFKRNVDVTYSGCTFEGYHYGYGGVFNAIYSSEDNKNALNLSLIRCSFRNNASTYGGSIYLSGYGHNISLNARHCRFEENSAASGGAIWAQDANLHLLDCSFIGNRYINEEADKPNGGALALYSCSSELDGCLIANNTSGGDGAGLFCEISPFRALILRNCTVIGNTAARDEGISVLPAKTKYDTSAIAHIYYSSLFGKQNDTDHTKRFGCLLVDSGIAEMDPNAENGYCLTLSRESAREKGLIPEIPAHVTLPEEMNTIPKEAAEKIAGNIVSDSLGEYRIGDNYKNEAVIEIESSPGHVKTVTLQYGDEISLEYPIRKGYSFDGWKYPKGKRIESGSVFLGGDLPEGKVTAEWHLVLSENLYLIWIPILGTAVIVILVFSFCQRKQKPALTIVPPGETVPEETVTLPCDWIDRACEQPNVTESLSRREMEVLHKLLEGKSRKQIAEELFVTEATIRKHSANIYSKLNVHNRTELIYRLTKQ